MRGLVERIIPHRIYSYPDACDALSIRPRQMLALKGSLVGYLDFGPRLCCFPGQSLLNWLLGTDEDALLPIIASIDPGRMYRVGEVAKKFEVPHHHVGRLRRDLGLPGKPINCRTFRYAGSDMQEFLNRRFHAAGDFDE